jgi:hypothetical protein
MRKLLQFLFPFALLVICVIRPTRAEAPQLAVCKDHVCVMSETDYRNLQAFAMKLRDYAQNAGQVDGEKEAFIAHLRNRLDSCEEWRDGHKAGWKR